MLRPLLVYGGLSGAIAIVVMCINVSMGNMGLLLGYAVLFAAMSLIFVCIKRYRDDALGGVIRFGTAVKLGLGISLVAGIVYVIGWELFLWSTGFDFFDHYLAVEMEAQRAAGASAAELAHLRAEMAALAERYNNEPLFRIELTLLEILPVGILVTFVSALLLRRSNFLPARARKSEP